jgi:cell wall-associated NlpC family hydrolase
MLDFQDLIGVPFQYGGRGPSHFDCYGLLKELQRRQGKDIPDYTSPTDGTRITALFALQLHLWGQCEQSEGASVLLRIPGNTHVGYMIDKNRMIHSWEGSGGVTIERLDIWKPRIRGFYRYVG